MKHQVRRADDTGADIRPWDNDRWSDDARLARLHSGRYWVYYVYDLEDGALLYIGCTGNMPQRVQRHSVTRYPRDRVRFEVEGPYTKYLALTIEARRISQLSPRDNVEKNRQR